MIHDRICLSRKVNSVSFGAEVLWVRILTMVDDNGNYSRDPLLIYANGVRRKKGVKQSHVEQFLNELIEIGLLLVYQAEEEEFIHVADFHDYQTLRRDRPVTIDWPPHPSEFGPSFLASGIVPAADDGSGKKKGHVYLVQVGDAGPVKIGFTEYPDRRIRELQAASLEELNCLAVIEGSEKKEKELHALFAAHNIKGEWFKPSEEIFSYFGVVGTGLTPGKPSVVSAGLSPANHEVEVKFKDKEREVEEESDRPTDEETIEPDFNTFRKVFRAATGVRVKGFERDVNAYSAACKKHGEQAVLDAINDWVREEGGRHKIKNGKGAPWAAKNFLQAVDELIEEKREHPPSEEPDEIARIGGVRLPPKELMV